MIALFTEPTKEAAYKKAEISRNTGYRYINDPEFKKHYMEMKRMVMQETTQSIQQASHGAVDVLIEILNDPDANNGDKIRVASIILDNSYEALELDDISERLESLEGLMNKDG